MSYLQIIELCHSIKNDSEQLKQLMKSSISTGVYDPFLEKKEDLDNWLDEIEFEAVEKSNNESASL